MTTALVTGANRGIGLSIAEKLAEKGIRVLLACRDISKAEQAIERIIDKIGVPEDMLIPLECDLDNVASVENMCCTIRDSVGVLDILINNAGVLLDKGKKFTASDISGVKKTFNTNFFGAYLLTSKVLPAMIDHGKGVVAMVSSGAGQTSQLIDDMPSYRLSKYALNGLVRLLASEVEGTNVRVIACDPGWVNTDMGGLDAPVQPDRSAEIIVDTVLRCDAGCNGQFFAEGLAIEW